MHKKGKKLSHVNYLLLTKKTTEKIISQTTFKCDYARRIVHFTVVCLVTRPLSGSEARVDLVLIQILLLFICKYKLVSMRTTWFTCEKQEGLYQNKTRSTPASLPLKGQVTKQTTVKWSIADLWWHWVPHYSPSIGKWLLCQRRVAHGEIKVVVSPCVILVNFRSCLKHVQPGNLVPGCSYT